MLELLLLYAIILEKRGRNVLWLTLVKSEELVQQNAARLLTSIPITLHHKMISMAPFDFVVSLHLLLDSFALLDPRQPLPLPPLSTALVPC